MSPIGQIIHDYLKEKEAELANNREAPIKRLRRMIHGSRYRSPTKRTKTLMSKSHHKKSDFEELNEEECEFIRAKSAKNLEDSSEN